MLSNIQANSGWLVTNFAMDKSDPNVETNSVADLESDAREDPTDSDADLPRAGNLDNGVDPIWVGSAEAMAVGLRTDAEACQADAATGGHAVDRFESSRGPTAVQPDQASVAVVCRDGIEQSASFPFGYLHFGPQATVSGAMLADPSRERGSELGFFEGLRSSHPSGEGGSSSNWARCTLTTTSGLATTTTTLTSTVVTFTAVGGPAYASYVRGPP